jgi:hypothetical protein
MRTRSRLAQNVHNIKSQKLGKQHEGVEPVFLQKDQAIGYAETRACAKNRRRARATIGLSRLLGSELRWLARIDSFY